MAILEKEIIKVIMDAVELALLKKENDKDNAQIKREVLLALRKDNYGK